MHIQEANIKNWVYDYYFDNLVKAKKLKSKNSLIDRKNYKDLTIYFNKYVYKKWIKMPNMHYYRLIWKFKEHEGINFWWLMIIC